MSRQVPLCSFMITPYPRSACTLLHFSHFFLHPSRSGHSPMTPSVLHWDPSYPSHPFLSLFLFFFLAICPGLLNYRFTTVYVILFVCAVCFVVYLTLSLLLDVVDRGGNKTALGYFHSPCPNCFRSHAWIFGGRDLYIVSMIDMIPLP